MAWIVLVTYSIILGAFFSKLPSYSFNWKHLFAINTVIITMYIWGVAQYEKGLVQGEPMYLIAFIVMFTVSSVISQASYKLFTFIFKR